MWYSVNFIVKLQLFVVLLFNNSVACGTEEQDEFL